MTRAMAQMAEVADNIRIVERPTLVRWVAQLVDTSTGCKTTNLRSSSTPTTTAAPAAEVLLINATKIVLLVPVVRFKMAIMAQTRTIK